MTFVALGVILIALWYALWPPYRSPYWWRDMTRPLRRLFRRHHYR